MKILVTFAVGTEFAAWRRQGSFRQVARHPFALYTGEIRGNTVRVLLSGVGGRAAAEAMRWALTSPTDLCISSGFAGGLRPELCVGDIVAARVAQCAEKDLAVASDGELLSTACDVGAGQVGRMLTASQLVMDPAEKAVLANQADAVDMESFVILAEAARHGVRAVVVRAVSDTAGTALPYDFGRMRDTRGEIRLSALAAEVLRRPQRLPALLRLARDCRLSAGRLAEFLNEYLEVLNARLEVSQSEMVTAR